MRFLITNDTSGEPSWWLYGANNEMVAWAGESFANLSNATRAAAAFKAGATTARFEVYADGAGKYRWRAWRSSDKVPSSGEAFESQSNAQRAADNVRQNAGTATGL